MTANLPFFTSELSQEVQVRRAEEGIAAVPAKTVLEVFDATVTRVGNKPALFQKRPQEVSRT